VTPGKINFLCPQGATFQKTVTIEIDQTPLNLSGYSSRLQVRENYYSANTIVNLLSSGSGLTISGSAGVIDILIADEITKDFPAGTFVYDLEIESVNGNVDRVLEGSFIITPEVTR
jgi:hypothetical protein